MNRPLKNRHVQHRNAQQGSSLIEVLVTLVILMLGLLGLVGLMVQSQRAQMESYQRALTVRQTLIDELGIDPDRIVAIGMGESEDPQNANLPGAEDEARRVIIKVKTLPQEN